MLIKRAITIAMFAIFGFLLSEGMSRAGVEFGTRMILYLVVIAVLVAIEFIRPGERGEEI